MLPTSQPLLLPTVNPSVTPSAIPTTIQPSLQPSLQPTVQPSSSYPSLSPSTDIITTIAGSSTSGSYSGDNGAATSAALNGPLGVRADLAGTKPHPILVNKVIFSLTQLGNVYISDASNQRIRKVTVSTGIITTVAGTGTPSYSGDGGQATSATLSNPHGIALDSSGTHPFKLLLLGFLFTIVYAPR